MRRSGRTFEPKVEAGTQCRDLQGGPCCLLQAALSSRHDPDGTGMGSENRDPREASQIPDGASASDRQMPCPEWQPLWGWSRRVWSITEFAPPRSNSMAKLAPALVALVMAACTSAAPASSSNISPSTAVATSSRASTPSSPAPAPPGAGYVDAKQVAIAGAVSQTGAMYLDGNVDVVVACPASTTKCIAIQSEVDGDHAAYFRARMSHLHPEDLGFYSAACFIYTFQDATGWHFLDMVCAGPESGVSWPDVGEFDYVFVTAGGCANVRATPGLSGKVVACLPAGTTVNIDGGPDYVVEAMPRVSHMWWHLQGKGWMAHDFLVPS